MSAGTRNQVVLNDVAEDDTAPTEVEEKRNTDDLERAEGVEVNSRRSSIEKDLSK